MNNHQEKLNIDEISWKVPVYHKHEHGRSWYLIAAIVAIAMIIYAITTANYFFALIIVIGSILIIYNDSQNPNHLRFVVGSSGIAIGSRFYDYDELQNFCILYKPDDDIKNLYFDFKRSTKRRLSIPLQDVNPLEVRAYLLRYLPEDLERTNEPLSEQLAKMLKL